MAYKIYRCVSDNKLIFPEDFEKHAGHRVMLASDGSLLEYFKVLYKKITKKLEERQHWQN